MELEAMGNMEAIAGQLQVPMIAEQNGTPIVLLPPGWVEHRAEDLLPAPLRVKQSTTVNDVASLKMYIDEFTEKDIFPRIFADEPGKRIVVVLDPSQIDEPSHQSHTAHLVLNLAPEWKVWKSFCGEYKPRKEFVRFIENHLENIVGDFSGSKILEMCRDIKATNTANADINEDLEQGTRRLTFGNNQEVRGGPTQIAFPEKIDVQLRVFKGDIKFKFDARLRWELNGNDLSFAIDLRDAEIVEENAFSQIVDRVIEVTGIPVLRGFYE